MRRRWTALAVGALAAVAIGCGGNDDAVEADEAETDPTEEPAVEEEATEEPEPEPTEEPEPESYEVQSGDTLSVIAEDFGVTMEDLIEANDIEDPDVLMEGQELVIP